MALVGEPIFLRLWIEDGATDKYVQAVVRNVFGVEVVGSPAILYHVGNGLYTNSISVIFPSTTPYLTATYLVYDDASFTILSDDYYNGGDDVFEVKIYEDLKLITNLIYSQIGSLVGEIDDMTCVVGEIVLDELLIGELIAEDYLVGEVIEEVLEGIIEDCLC